MASYSISYTETTISFTVTGIKSGDKLVFYVRYEPDTGVMLVDAVHNNGGPHTASGSSFGISFSVLSANTTYACNVDVNGTRQTAKIFTTPGKVRPANWSWSGVYSGAPFRNLTSEWNGFTGRINEFRVYKGLSSGKICQGRKCPKAHFL